MDLTLSKEELNKALYLTQNIVAKKTTMPILVNVLLSATKDQLKLSATDLEVTAVASAKAKIRSTGSTTVNAKVFADIVKELPDGDISLKLTEGERLEITSGGSKLRIIGVSAEEFPSLPGLGAEVSSKISSKELLDMINKTIYAVSLDETRFNLNGVCFEMNGKAKKGGTLKMVATDGHRLAIVSRPTPELQFEGSFIVPRRGLSEIRKLLDQDDDTQVGIDFREGFLLLESGDSKVSIRLVDGEFPNYDQVVPKDKGTVAVLNSQELAQALRRVALMVTDRGKCVKLDFSQDRLRISSSSPELGDANEELPVKYGGKPISIGFNALYVLDVLSSVPESQSILVELHGELGAAKLSSESDESYLAIVMPMRLNS